MSQKLIVQARRFLTLSKGLYDKGMTKKDIAQHLGLYPSAFSSLSNVVFKKLILTQDEDDPHVISAAFAEANNVSEKRVRREMATYLDKLERLHNLNQAYDFCAKPAFVNKLLNELPKHNLSQLIGTYYCYYVSTFGYQVKKEPLLISQNSEGHFLVQKGNIQSPAIYKGNLFLSNSHLLSIQLEEQEILNRDHFMIHLHFPPSYPSSLRILRGFSISMSNARFPISRRFILEKQNGKTESISFNTMKTEFFPPESSFAKKGIVAYLYQSRSLMECLPIPRPRFDEQDLATELQISYALSEDNF